MGLEVHGLLGSQRAVAVGGRNDQVDAEAICEAMNRPGMRIVAVKSIAGQDVLAAHRIREELVGPRTTKTNQIRGLVGNFGIIAPVGIR